MKAFQHPMVTDVPYQKLPFFKEAQHAFENFSKDHKFGYKVQDLKNNNEFRDWRADQTDMAL